MLPRQERSEERISTDIANQVVVEQVLRITPDTPMHQSDKGRQVIRLLDTATPMPAAPSANELFSCSLVFDTSEVRANVPLHIGKTSGSQVANRGDGIVVDISAGIGPEVALGEFVGKLQAHDTGTMFYQDSFSTEGSIVYSIVQTTTGLHIHQMNLINSPKAILLTPDTYILLGQFRRELDIAGIFVHAQRLTPTKWKFERVISAQILRMLQARAILLG